MISETATHAAVVNGPPSSPACSLCGPLETRKPFDASFEFHRDERLTLLGIVGPRLPAAEFAFLSARHTAELTDGSVANAGLHLAATMQYRGFRSVVEATTTRTNTDKTWLNFLQVDAFWERAADTLLREVCVDTQSQGRRTEAASKEMGELE
jgi:hypothetical protein